MAWVGLVLLLLVCLLLTLAPPTGANGTISGVVYQDFNANGARDTTTVIGGQTAGAVGAAIDRGVAGITVTAFDTNGAFQGSTVTAGDGSYTLSLRGSGPYRVEFSTLPEGYQPSAQGPDNGTTVQFVPEGTSTNISLGINRPADFCQNNPSIAVTCQAGFWGARSDPALWTFPYVGGSRETQPEKEASYQQPRLEGRATQGELGSTYGLAYQRSSKSLFSGAFLKTLTLFGPGGSGAIYRTDLTTGQTSLYVDLNRLFGQGTAGIDPHLPGGENPANPGVFAAVGKAGLGDLDLSEDEGTLFAINLADRQLYLIPVNRPLQTPTVESVGRVAVPTALPGAAQGCPEDDVRPFGLGVNQGLLYVGLVCSAESTVGAVGHPNGDRGQLRAYIYAYEPVQKVFSAVPALEFPLNYARGTTFGPAFQDGRYAPAGPESSGGKGEAPIEWNPWLPTFDRSKIYARQYFGRHLPWFQATYPMPVISDIVFDNGDMVIGLRDLFPDKMNGLSTDPTDTLNEDNQAPNASFGRRHYGTVSAGDILRACATGTGGWRLEANGRCGSVAGAARDNGQGPGRLVPPANLNDTRGSGEFYADNYESHADTGLGGLAQGPGFPDVLQTVFDPMRIPVRYADGGVAWLSQSNGALTKAYLVYDDASNNAVFGNGNVLGDIEILCDQAPIEIGNRLWIDRNQNGVQDAGEPALAGIAVHLVSPEGTLLDTAISDRRGHYLFSSATGQTSGFERYAVAGLKSSTSGYELRVDLNQPGLRNLRPAPAGVDSSAGGAARDSNGVTANERLVVPVTTGPPGSIDHRFDMGFQPLGSKEAADIAAGDEARVNGLLPASLTTLLDGSRGLLLLALVVTMGLAAIMIRRGISGS